RPQPLKPLKGPYSALSRGSQHAIVSLICSSPARSAANLCRSFRPGRAGRQESWAQPMRRAMDATAVRAVLARAPAIRAAHVQALVAAADGDLTRAIELETLNSVNLPPAARASLVFPDEARLNSDLEWIEA